MGTPVVVLVVVDTSVVLVVVGASVVLVGASVVVVVDVCGWLVVVVVWHPREVVHGGSESQVSGSRHSVHPLLNSIQFPKFGKHGSVPPSHIIQQSIPVLTIIRQCSSITFHTNCIVIP